MPFNRKAKIATGIGVVLILGIVVVAVVSKKASAAPAPKGPLPPPPKDYIPPASGGGNTGATYTIQGEGTPSHPWTDSDLAHLDLKTLIAKGLNPPPIQGGIGYYQNKPKMTS